MANTSNESFTNFTPYEMKKGEEYMSADMREHFKELLRQWKQELMEEVDRTMHHMQEDAANYADPSDRATQEEEFSLELRTRDRERKLIKKVRSGWFRLVPSSREPQAAHADASHAYAYACRCAS